MKKFILAIAVTLTGFGIQAQNDYEFGIGLRGGFANGLTIKAATGNASAIEGILALRPNGFQGTLLFERATDLGVSDSNLNLFYGIGGHVGAFGSGYEFYPENNSSSSVINLGVDAILGLEYSFDSVPFSVSMDIKPAIDFVYRTPVYMGGALSLRYIMQ